MLRCTYEDLPSISQSEYLNFTTSYNLNPDTLLPNTAGGTSDVVGGERTGYSPISTPRNIQKAVSDSSGRINPDWTMLAGRISCRYIEFVTPETFTGSVELGKDNFFPKAYEFIMRNADELNNMIDISRNNYFDYRSFSKMIMYCNRSFQVGSNKKVQHESVVYFENPQYTFLREAIQLCIPYCSSGDIIDTDHISTLTLSDDTNLPDDQILLNIKDRYDDLSLNLYTHASPTIFNALKDVNNLSSCYLKSCSDNLQSITKNWSADAILSSIGGGIGESKSDLRKGPVSGGGWSDGNKNWLSVDSAIAYVMDQRGLRKASKAEYLSLDHVDFKKFLEFGLNEGGSDGYQSERARNLFYGAWVPDLFFKRVKGCDRLGNKYDKNSSLLNNGKWTMFSPCQAPGLNDVYGVEYERLYLEYEAMYERGEMVPGTVIQVQADALFQDIIKTQMQTGMPYMCYKDAANRKSNQKNFGVIKNSNLCTEIFEVTSKIEFEDDESYDAIASCNLATINLKAHVKDESFDFEQFKVTVAKVVENINNVIDRTYYPSEEDVVADIPTYGINVVKTTNKRSRPMGLGVQGLADVCVLLGIPFESEEAKMLSKQIFEVMYFESVKRSAELAQDFGNYYYFDGSPISKGLLSCDLWDLEKLELELEFVQHKILDNIEKDILSDQDSKRVIECQTNISNFLKDKTNTVGSVSTFYTPEEYSNLRSLVQQGVRNSLLIAQPPTASTSTIFDNTPSVEALQPVIYSHRTIDGYFNVINRMFFNEMWGRGWWNNKIISKIISCGGNVSGLTFEDCGVRKEDVTPSDIEALTRIKELFKHGYEMSQKKILDQAMERNRFIDQGVSHNVFFTESDNLFSKLRAYHVHSWKTGAKTGSYYTKILLDSTPNSSHITSSLNSDEDDKKAMKNSKFLQRLGKEECFGCGA